MNLTADRIDRVSESVTSGTTANAKARRDAGEDVINLAAGELEVNSPPAAVAAAITAASDPTMHHYGPPAGLPQLRRTVASRLSRPGAELGVDNVLVTTGTKQALFTAILTTIGPGDEVLLPAPYWTSYPTMIELAGGLPVEVLAGHAHEFKVTVAMLEKAVTSRTKMLIFVSPGNPTGAVYTESETRAIGEWALAHGLIVLSDEIYDELVDGPTRAPSIADVVPELRPTCLRAGGVGKNYAMTGWRIGWLVGPTEIIAPAAALQSHTTGHPALIAQAAAIAVLQAPQAEWMKDVHTGLKHRRTAALAALRGIPGVDCATPAGAFYVFPSVHHYIGMEINGRTVHSTVDLADILVAATGTVVVPGEAFGAPGYLRISCAVDELDLSEGIRRLAELLKTAQQAPGA